jgi:hypothetical protein
MKIDGEDTKSTVTKWRPYFDLTLNTPVYKAGIGYNRNVETDKAKGSPSVTLTNETYYGILGWKPEELPSLDLLIQRRNTFDEKRTFQDITQDYFSLTSRYVYKTIDLRYTGSYTDLKDKITNIETEDMLHTGRATYSDSFFNKRVYVNTSYYITYDRTTISLKGAGGGEVKFPIFPFAGLFLISNTPNLVTLPANAGLIDGDVNTGTGINIGVPPPAGNDPRNIGLDLLNPTEVNDLLLWVDRDLPSGISDYFSWDVYTSPDNLNWTKITPVPIQPAPFGPFQNSFEIRFPNVTTRYIKVVTNPLTVAAAALVPTFTNPDRIFVTELQAFLARPSSAVIGTGKERTVTTLSHILQTEAKARIFDIPSLYYDFSYFLTRSQTDGSAQLTWILSNGLSLNHTLSKVFSVAARVAREDGAQENRRAASYVYNASIMATPLRTLRHSLAYAGRNNDIDGKTSNTNSVYLNNSAELYKGIDINLGGGYDWQKRETGERVQNTTVNCGVSIIPNSRTTLTVNYSGTNTHTSGGEKPGFSTFSRIGEVALSYNPFDTLRLYASVGVSSLSGARTDFLQNYAINWSPFPEGNLQFNISYNEDHRSADNFKERSFTPSVRWKITRKTFLDLSYLMIKTSSNAEKSDTNGFNANLKVFF